MSNTTGFRLESQQTERRAGHLTDDTQRLLGRDPFTLQFVQDFAEVWASVPVGV